MADRNVELAIKIAADAADAEAAFDKVGNAAKSMGDDVDAAVRQADTATSRLDGVADSADNLASRAGQATGGLGALSSGFELVGAEKYAAGLQTAAMATDFFSGVGDIANLVLTTQAGAFIKARVTAIASTVATKGQTVATKAMTVAQRALNLVMRANPIGLIITAVLALVGGLVLLYKRSERFRDIVNAVGKAGQKALGWIVDAAVDVGRWIGEKVPQAAAKMRDLVVGYVKFITTPWRLLIGVIRDVADFVRDKVPGAFNAMKTVVTSAIDAVLEPFRKVRDLVNEIIDLIGKIKIPDLPSLPDLNPFNRSSASTASKGTGVSPSTIVNNTVNVNGVTDAPGAARSIDDLLARRARQLGLVTA